MSYPINSPVTFVSTTNGDTLDFNAVVGGASPQNVITEFVTSTAGDIIYQSGAPSQLDRLPVGSNGSLMTVAAGLPSYLAIGTNGQLLTVSGGAPVWTSNPISTSTAFLANGTAALATVASGSTWVTVSGTVVTWNDSTTPAHDAGGLFNTTTGEYSPGVAGLYNIRANVAFAGRNTGNGSIAGRSAIRQARLQVIAGTNSGLTLCFAESQTQASNLNPTQLVCPGMNYSLAADDVVVLQVRHDATIALNLIVTAGSLIYSANRIA